MKQFDVIVIGSGPAGQKAAVQAAKAGKTVAIVVPLGKRFIHTLAYTIGIPECLCGSVFFCFYATADNGSQCDGRQN